MATQPPINPSSQRFDRIARNYLVSEVHSASPTIARLHKLTDLKPGASICDIACGAGHLGLSFAPVAGRLVAVDASPRMLEVVQNQAKEKGTSIETVQSPAEAIPLPDNQFDLVASRLAPHHFQDVQQAVREMARIAKRGAWVAIIDMHGSPNLKADALNHQIEMWHDPTHIRSYTPARWSEFFQAAGIEITTFEPNQAEFPAGLSVNRWCSISECGPAAEANIRAALAAATPAVLQELGVTRREDDFYLSIRTILLVGKKTR